MVSMVSLLPQPPNITASARINPNFFKLTPPERNSHMKLLITYLLIINAAGFLLMLIDKWKARKKRWRIPEATLMTVAALGGSIGSLLGMYTFRHKTRHPKFTLGIPLILALQLVAATWILIYQ